MTEGRKSHDPTAGTAASRLRRIWRAWTNFYLSVTTDSQGHYARTGLPVGNYQVQFAKAGSYQTRWYLGATVRGHATTLTLTDTGFVADQALPPL